ncbi:MAG: EAL domain-containing protein [Actinomycetota bacterium]|nr:EAL domain-containing protein [Actinomycetota bacterium]
MSAPMRPSLRRLSLSSVTWHLSVWVGLGVLAAACAAVSTGEIRAAGAALAMTAVLLVVLELRPIIASGSHDPQGVALSTAFIFAMLLMWGLWPAIIVQTIATVCSEVRKRKPAWKHIFNVGQYNVSLAAAALVLPLTGVTPSLTEPLREFELSHMPWVALSWLVYFVVNNALVSGVLSYTDDFRALFLDDIAYYAITTFAVLALSPLVVVVAQAQWALLPLLLLPLLLVLKTAQMSLEKEHQAAHDALTGLPNRKLLQSRLTDVAARAARTGDPFGLMLIDLDHFKEVNDTLGHHVGDQLLLHFAERLSESVRPGDVVARLGGDEFAVIVLDAREPHVRAVAERLHVLLSTPVELEGVVLDVEASVGIALVPDHGSDPDELLRLADVAMYDAKENRTGVATYRPDRDRNSTDRLGLLGELRLALDDEQLELHYQPKVSLAHGGVLGLEALVRWRHPERGLVPPDQFVPLAERSGIMHLLTEAVVTMALRQAASWRDAGINVPVAVNVSLADLTGSRLASLVATRLEHHSLPAGALELEITERVVDQETDELEPVLAELKRLGVMLSLDDFGTGYSSLLRLQSLPVGELKIDRAFVSRLSDGTAAVGMVRAVVDLAHAMGMPAIAEGVETAEEWDVLASLGCDGAQGWYIARPMPVVAATPWLQQHLYGNGSGVVAHGSVPVGAPAGAARA